MLLIMLFRLDWLAHVSWIQHQNLYYGLVERLHTQRRNIRIKRRCSTVLRMSFFFKAFQRKPTHKHIVVWNRFNSQMIDNIQRFGLYISRWQYHMYVCYIRSTTISEYKIFHSFQALLMFISIITFFNVNSFVFMNFMT